MARYLLLLAMATGLIAADRPPVYVALWFDTEDYIEPAADDAALRIAGDLTALGVRGTFKMVAEKARVIERRNRLDVIRALALHDIGYHSESHSQPPTPAVYLNGLGYHEGAAEFERREGRGAVDVRRIFGVIPSCYGQPGNSWGPQTNLALRRMGIFVYLDEGSQVALNDQPFWYGGLLYAYHMGPFTLRAELEPKTSLAESLKRFDDAAAEIERRGGGLISTYYHPTEFVTTEFWDGVNFPGGASREPSEWKMAGRRTPQDSERCYGLLRAFVAHAKQRGNVRFVTARDLLQLYAGPDPPRVNAAIIREHLRRGITFLDTPAGALSPAEMLQVLLGLEPRVVDGPETRQESTLAAARLARVAFERAKKDAADFIRTREALPSRVWIGSAYLSPADFTATLAGDDGRSPEVEVRKGALLFEKHFAADARQAFSWPIHPAGFNPVALMELGRLQGWTLKPARLR
jgi:hypothetical protein